MGANKALLRLTPGGPTVIEMVVAALNAAGFDAPLVVTNSAEEYAFLGLRCVPDEITGAGALGGILTALIHSEGANSTLVVACDMPLLNPALLQYMASIDNEYDALVPRWVGAGETRLEPLHAIYSERCADIVRREILAKRLKLGDFLRNVNTIYLDEAELRRFDPRLVSFCNVNTPDEWAKLTESQEEIGRWTSER